MGRRFGSVEFGKTRVLCTASVDEKLPPFRMGKGIGWLVCRILEMLLRTHTRTVDAAFTTQWADAPTKSNG
jgi:ribonuclease PH